MQASNAVEKQSRDYALDIIKAICALFVLLSHLEPFQFSVVDKTHVSALFRVPIFLVEILDTQVLRIAVPGFFIVSLFLYFKKSSAKFSYLKPRLLHLLKIYIFWTLIQSFVYCILWVSSKAIKSDWDFPKTSIYEVIFLGGPPLPFMLSSVFYFLADLIVLTILAFLYSRLSSKLRTILGIAIIFCTIVYFEVLEFSGNPLIFWRLDSFLIYIPTAYFLFKYLKSAIRYRYLFLSAFLFFSAVDVILGRSGIYVGTYGRTSIFFGALTLFCFIYFWFHQEDYSDFQERKESQFIRFISKYALGIFALQRYWQLIFLLLFHQIFGLLKLPEFITISALQINLINPIIGILVISCCILSTRFLSSTRLKGFV